MKRLRKKKFSNTHVKSTLRSLGHFFLWFIGFYKEKRIMTPIPQNFLYPNYDGNTITDSSVTWINHATFMVKVEDVTFLTDPIFSKRCSPVFFCGPKRHHSPLPDLSYLPRVDYLLISHNHYDHLDLRAIRMILKRNPNVKIIVPENLKRWFLHKKIGSESSVFELKWYERQEFKEKKMTITSVPAQHFSGRGLFDKNKTHWMGIVVEIGGKRFYFVGDTGYNNKEFREIKENFGSMDLSLIPIGAYYPRKFMQSVHINPDEAVQIHEDVESRLSVAGHFSTFKLAEEELHRPPFDLYLALNKKKIPVEKFRVLNPGQKIYW